MAGTDQDSDTARRARDWRRAGMDAACDVVEPWQHGTVWRATRYPSYYDYNVLWVEGDPGLSADELIAAADSALAGLEHRRIDFERAEAGDLVRSELEAAHWEATRLVWMLHTEPLPPGPEIQVTEVGYDAVLDLRHAWHAEDFRDLDTRDYLENARDVAMTRDVQVLAAVEADEPVGFAQVERMDAAAEVTQVYVLPERRGGGRGTAITRAAIEAAGEVEELWIVADDEGRPKQLYARLGFRAAWTSMEFLRVPGVAGYEG
jgi:ribosomal protein S18 acetylase RimI-like enzyme